MNWQTFTTPLSIQPNEVHLVGCSIAQLAYSSKALECLSSQEAARALQFKFEKHQQLYRLSHTVLRHVLAYYTHSTPASIEFSYNPNNKPFLKKNPHIQFNLSHSDDQLMIAITPQHLIGVDIQKLDTLFRQNLAERFFSREEADYLQHLPSRLQALKFYQLWTHKEAFIKAIGRGLSHNLKKFVIGLDPSALLQADEFDIENWTLHSFDWQIGYAGAFATEQSVNSIKYFQINELK